MVSTACRFGIAASVVTLVTAAANVVAVADWPQTSPATRLITLGTRSGPFPTPDRAQSSNVLVVNDRLYLVDAGDGTTRRLAATGLPVRNLDAIFLTHLHDDHTTGLVPLMSVEYDFDRREAVRIYGPPGTEALIDAAVAFLTVNSDIRLSDGTRAVKIATVFRGHDQEPGLVYEDSNVTVHAIENNHFNFPAGSPSFDRTKSFSYRVQTPDRTIVFSGDTGPSAAVADFARGADLLVTEISSFEELKALRTRDGSWDRWTPEQQANYVRHMTEEHLEPEAVGRMAARAGVGAVVLTHLPASGVRDDDYRRYADIVTQHFSGPVMVATDGMEFTSGVEF